MTSSLTLYAESERQIREKYIRHGGNGKNVQGLLWTSRGNSNSQVHQQVCEVQREINR